MTIDEAINELTQCYSFNSKTAEKKNEAISMAIKALEKRRWIPVTERLPEKSGYYLATVDIGWKVVDVIYFNNASGFLMPNTVKAWKPTPEPYHGSKVNMRSEKYD